jgi:arylsulfatase A
MRLRPATSIVTIALLLLSACGAQGPGGSATPTPTAPPPAPPNVVLILADDLGWGDLSSYGSTTIATPNIDRLAAGGMRFTQYYANPVCAPSRASLMTGRWPVRAGVPWNPPLRLNPGEITVADALRAAGYKTAMVGKWHLGWEAPDFPTHHGFDTYYGQIANEDQDAGGFIRGDQPTTDPADVVRPAQLTTRYTDEAVSLIHSHKADRFFLYLAYKDPHTPLYGAYDEVVEALDAAVGRVVQALHDDGIDGNTLVIFTSDNGPPEGLGSTGPLSGRKFGIGEGGVRMPAIFNWPQRIPTGRVLDQPIANLDIFPTLVTLAGGRIPTDRTYDGVDVSKLLTGDSTTLTGPGIDEGREFLYWSSERALAIRSGKWKFVRKYSNGSTPALYDLTADVGEHQNLWGHPDRESLWRGLDARIDALSASATAP